MVETGDPPATFPDGDDIERSLEALLVWARDAGLDFAVSETPVDRFAQAMPAQASPAQAVTARGEAAANVATPRRPVVSGADAARARSLDELRDMLEDFDGVALKKTASRLVFSDGNPKARLMLVGEAPGAEEDRTGKPFVGRAGQLLDRMLAAIGLDRTQVYIANVVPWRPPGNRTPTPQETAVCLPFITRQIELVAPRVLVCLGASSAQSLLGIEGGVMRARGQWRTFRTPAFEARALTTLHPAYLLRQPGHKRLAWRDLRLIRAALHPGGD